MSATDSARSGVECDSDADARPGGTDKRRQFADRTAKEPRFVALEGAPRRNRRIRPGSAGGGGGGRYPGPPGGPRSVELGGGPTGQAEPPRTALLDALERSRAAAASPTDRAPGARGRGAARGRGRPLRRAISCPPQVPRMFVALLALAHAESTWFAEDFAYPRPPRQAAVTAKLAEARARLQAGDAAGAEPSCVAAAKLDEAFPPVHVCRAVARMFQGDLATAEAEAARATTLDPAYAMGILWQARVRTAQGKVDVAAFQLYQAVLAQHPDEPVVLFEGAQVALTLARTDLGAKEDWYARADAWIAQGLGLDNAREAPGLYVQSVLSAEENSNALGASMAWEDAASAVRAGSIPDSAWLHLMRVRIAVRAILDPDPAATAVVLGGWCADHTCRSSDPATAPVPAPGAIETIDLGSGFTTTQIASNEAGLAYYSAMAVHAMRATPPAEYHAWMRAELETLTGGPLEEESKPWRAAVDMLDRQDAAARAAIEAMPDKTQALRLYRMAERARETWNPK